MRQMRILAAGLVASFLVSAVGAAPARADVEASRRAFVYATNPLVRLATCYAVTAEDRMQEVREGSERVAKTWGSDESDTLAVGIMMVGGYTGIGIGVVADCRKVLEPMELKLYSPAVYSAVYDRAKSRFLGSLLVEDEKLRALCRTGRPPQNVRAEVFRFACGFIARTGTGVREDLERANP